MTIRECTVIRAEGDSGLLHSLDPTDKELCDALSPTQRETLVEEYNKICRGWDGSPVSTAYELPDPVFDEYTEWFVETDITDKRSLAYTIMEDRDAEYAISFERSTMTRHYTVLVINERFCR